MTASPSPRPAATAPPRRVEISRAGSYDKMKVVPFTPPAPGPDDVVVETEAIGVNYADVMVRMGLYATARQFGWPMTPGFESAGRVAAVGSNVADLKVGDPVVAVSRFGGYASHVVTPRAFVFARPEALSAVEAAGFPTVFLTAWYALREQAHPRPGAKILVHSAAGGVGTALVQLGKLLGGEVTGVVGASHKVEAVRDNGADHVIDKRREDLWARARAIAPDGFDVVLDANGVETLRKSYDHLAKGGKLVVYGFHTMIPKVGGRPNWLKLARDFLRTPRFSPLSLTEKNRSVMAFNLSDLFDRVDILEDAMAELGAWLAEGRIRAPKVTTYPMERVGDAHRDLESGQTVGKLVLVP